MTSKPPTASELREAMVGVATLTAAVEALAIEVRKQTLFRRRATTAGIVFVLFSVCALGFTVRHFTQANRQFFCESINSSNKAILDILDTASAGSPKDPPTGATAEEISVFREQQKRGAIFIQNTHKRLAPKRC